MKPIIDVSKHQGAVDWAALAPSIDGAIIRAGYGREISQKDPLFEKNYEQARANGVPVGVYWYSYATSVAAAVEEAKVCLQVLGNRPLDLPLYFDQEEQRTPVNIRTECAVAFLDYIKSHSDYIRGFYASTYWLRDMNMDFLLEVCETLWQADYRVRPEILPETDLHQYTSKANFPGVNTSVDANYQVGGSLREICKDLRAPAQPPVVPGDKTVIAALSEINAKLDNLHAAIAAAAEAFLKGV